MTTPEQDKIVEALVRQHGAAKVLPLHGTDAVLACGWSSWLEDANEDNFCGPWWYVPADPARKLPYEPGPLLRYAYEQEIKDAHEQAAVRDLLSAAGLGL